VGLVHDDVFECVVQLEVGVRDDATFEVVVEQLVVVRYSSFPDLQVQDLQLQVVLLLFAQNAHAFLHKFVEEVSVDFQVFQQDRRHLRLDFEYELFVLFLLVPLELFEYYLCGLRIVFLVLVSGIQRVLFEFLQVSTVHLAIGVFVVFELQGVAFVVEQRKVDLE